MKRAALVASVLCILSVTWLGWRGLQAERHLTTARGSLSQAQAALAAQDLPRAEAALTAAAGQTAAARRLTSDVAWRVAGQIPLAGRTLRTVTGVAAGADDLTRTALPGALTAARAVDLSALRGPDGRIDLAQVAAAQPALERSATSAADVQERLEALPAEDSVEPVRDAAAMLLTQVSQLARAAEQASTGARLAPVLLGGDRPRRWFVLIQQPGESRGTGGLPGAFAILEASDGRLQVTEQGPIGALPGGRGPGPALELAPEFVERYEPLGAFDYWVNVNLSPDLPTVARSIDHRWTAAGKPPLDGVITLDPVSLTALLRGGGPVDVGGGRILQPEEVGNFLAVEQYEGVPQDDDQDDRKERLQDISRNAVLRLTSGGGDTRALLSGVAEAVSSGHLRVASIDPEVAPLLADAGIDGALPRGDAPLAYAVVNNFSGGKLETWLSRSLTYTAGRCDGDLRRSRIELTLRSDPPADLPPYVTSDLNLPGLQSRDSRLRTTVYTTPGAVLETATLDGEPLRPGVLEPGRPVLTPGFEAGLPLWDITLELVPGQERVLALDLVEPTAAGAARTPEQPLIQDLDLDIGVPTCAGDGT